MKFASLLVAAVAGILILSPAPLDAFCVHNDGSQCVTILFPDPLHEILAGPLPFTNWVVYCIA
jgi:hypothetical protein